MVQGNIKVQFFQNDKGELAHGSSNVCCALWRKVVIHRAWDHMKGEPCYIVTIRQFIILRDSREFGKLWIQKNGASAWESGFSTMWALFFRCNETCIGRVVFWYHWPSFYGCGGISGWAFCGLLTDHFHEWVRQLQLSREGGGEYVEWTL
jgi:hypothetical protein